MPNNVTVRFLDFECTCTDRWTTFSEEFLAFQDVFAKICPAAGLDDWHGLCQGYAQCSAGPDDPRLVMVSFMVSYGQFIPMSSICVWYLFLRQEICQDSHSFGVVESVLPGVETASWLITGGNSPSTGCISRKCEKPRLGPEFSQLMAEWYRQDKELIQKPLGSFGLAPTWQVQGWGCCWFCWFCWFLVRAFVPCWTPCWTPDWTHESPCVPKPRLAFHHHESEVTV